MRKVRWYKYETRKTEERTFLERTLQGEAVFHAWGVDFEECNMGVGNYSTAIIELEDGKVGNVAVENVEFIK